MAVFQFTLLLGSIDRIIKVNKKKKPFFLLNRALFTQVK